MNNHLYIDYFRMQVINSCVTEVFDRILRYIIYVNN